MKEQILAILRYLRAFFRWTFIGVVIGILCGAVGGVFAMAVEHVTEIRMHHEWLLYLLPLGGLLIALWYRFLRLPLSMGTDEIFTTVRTQGKVPLQMAPAIFVSTVITHLLGGSSGREGAALQLGGSIGAAVGDLVPQHKDRRRIFELCGMAALFSALFGTPFTATIFVLEIIEVGRINHRGLLPCVSAALAGTFTAKTIGAPQEPWVLGAGLQAANGLGLFKATVLGMCCALVAMVFCRLMHKSGKLARRLLPNDFLRVAVGGAAVIVLTLLCGTRDYNGGGMHVIFDALAGHARPEAFLLKMLFTAVSLSCGFKGGEIVPSFFIGATMGCTAASLIGFSPEVGAAIGMIGVFCGVTNTPLASLMLSVELFGSEYLPLFGVAVAVAFMLSGHVSLYHTQMFVENKMGHREKNAEAGQSAPAQEEEN